MTEFYEVRRSTPVCNLPLADSSMEVSLAYRFTPRNETRYELAVAAVRDPEALSKLAFFQGDLQGQLSEVEDSKQHESPAAGEQRRAQD